jgi:hypothetical protein
LTGWPPSLSLLFPCVGAGLQPGILIAPSGPQRSDRGFFSISSEEFRYPLTLNISQIVAADGTLSQQTTSDQKFKHNLSDPSFASAVENEVTTTDTLQFDASFNLTGHTGQQSSQHFHTADTRGH